MANKIIKYRSDLKLKARELRKNPTKAEKELWTSIRKKQLNVEFHRQVPILDYIVDFYCHEIGLVIEVDGSSHENKVLKDGLRQGRLEKVGLTVLRFTNDEVILSLQDVLRRIKNQIEESLL